jgi:hypothetical protein
MAFWSGLPVEFDEAGQLVPIAVTRERRRAYLRECYPNLYRTQAKDSSNRRGGFAAGFVTGAAAALVAVSVFGLWLR